MSSNSEFGRYLADIRRASGKSQRRLAESLCDVSGRITVTRHEVSRWERGERVPTSWLPYLATVLNVPLETLERVLANTTRVQETSPAITGPQRTPDDEERLLLAARNPSRVDSAVVADLSNTLAGQRRIEDVIGSESVIEPATAQLRLMIRLLREARGPIAGELTTVASEASQFSGWLHSATGRHDNASELYDQALRLGLQASDEDLAATALSMRGHLAWVTGDIGSMAALSRTAADMATAAGTRTVAIQQHGRALAIMGDRDGALRAIGDAEQQLAAKDTGDAPDSLYFYGPEILRMQRGLVLAYLADTPAHYTSAASMISDAINALPASVRDSEWVAWYRVRAAAAHATVNATDEAAQALREAHAIVSATGASKTLADITKVHARMTAKWPTRPSVIELGEQIA
jgi:transcriptional regulator with XRE-family HTH domain